jgi:basic amino acid/polyamine antiporter, APA family
MATAIVVGTVIGSGVFKKPQSVAEHLPAFSLAAAVWIAGGVLALLGSLALAEVTVLYPRAGGNYVFLREGFGPMAGFLWGWVEFWIIRTGSIAALATIFTESLHDILRGGERYDVLTFWEQRGLTVAVILGLAYVNVRGVRWGGLVQLLITFVKVLSLLTILTLPFIFMALNRLPEQPAAPPAAQAALSQKSVGLGNILTALLAVLWAYHGWMNVAPVAEEVKEPRRNIPLAFVAGTLTVIVLYLGANLAYYLVLPGWEMAGSKDTPVATLFSFRLLGQAGVLLMSAAILFSVFGALNGNLLVGPRLLYAMAEDKLAPQALAEVHARYRTPALAIVVMAGWSCLLVLGAACATHLDLTGTKPLFDILTDFAMFGAVIFETLAVATIFVFRRKFPHAERAYRCPGYPWVPLAYMVLPALVLGNYFFSQQLEAAIGTGFIVAGAGVYLLIRNKS